MLFVLFFNGVVIYIENMLACKVNGECGPIREIIVNALGPGLNSSPGLRLPTSGLQNC